MIIDLTSLKSSSLDLNFTFAPETIDLEGEDAKLISAVELQGRLLKGSVGVTIAGEIAAAVEIECTRCLKAVERKLPVSFNSEYITAENFTAAKEAELQINDLDATVYEGDKIDLTELVREQILLNIPEQIFCAGTCRGLCEKCGANRNLLDCNCIEKDVDPRWSALKNLR